MQEEVRRNEKDQEETRTMISMNKQEEPRRTTKKHEQI